MESQDNGRRRPAASGHAAPTQRKTASGRTRSGASPRTNTRTTVNPRNGASTRSGASPRTGTNSRTSSSPRDRTRATTRTSIKARSGVRANARTGASARIRNPRLLAPLIVAIVLLLVVAVGAFACSSCSSRQAQSGSSQASQATGALTATDIAARSDAAAASSAASTTASSGDLAWRDADFAVDPARTDWNYDSNGRKVVYLTIDDGPSELTQQVLDILDQYGCHATFFVVGHSSDYFPMIKEAYDRGHTIGLHTYSHDYASVYASEDAYYADLDAIAQVVKDQIGYVPCFIRFPGGSSNSISANYCQGIMSSLVDSVQARGFQYYDWNMSSGDGADHTADEIVAYSTEPTDMENIVLLCHDSATKQSTVDALPRIIEHYQSLGYTFEALDRDALVPHHGTNN